MPIHGIDTNGLSVMGREGSCAVCWDHSTMRVVRVPASSASDIKPDYGLMALDNFIDYLYLTNFKLNHSKMIKDRENAGSYLINDVVRVEKGKTAPIGAVGVVVHTMDAHYGPKGLAKKHCIAISDVVCNKQARSGRTYTAHKDVVWAWAKNLTCIMLNPKVLMQIDTIAKSETDKFLSGLGIDNVKWGRRGPEHDHSSLTSVSSSVPVTSINVTSAGSGYHRSVAEQEILGSVDKGLLEFDEWVRSIISR